MASFTENTSYAMPLPLWGGTSGIITLEDDMLPEVQDARVALLARADGWYRERRCPIFVHYVEATCVEYAERAALADLGEGKLWIISSRLLPEFLEHLCEATTPRSSR